MVEWVSHPENQFLASCSLGMLCVDIDLISRGPGGASMLGLFTEIGPCLVPDGDNLTTEFNPYSWNNFANMLFIE